MDRRILSIEDAKIHDKPCVYGLLDSDLVIFYVGRTKGLKRRIKSHLKYCHNKRLEQYIKTNGIHGVELLSDYPEDELYFIDKYKENSMNIITSEFNNTMLTKESKPWMAGTGIKCPSDYIMWNAAKYNRKKVKDLFPDVLRIRNGMNDTERCAFEVSLYRENIINNFVIPALKKWLDLTLERMLFQMESTLGA